MTETREEKGRQIATMLKIRRKGDVWIVPSQSGEGKYEVSLDGECPHCTCPDHEMRQVKCKHIFAVELSIQRQRKIETQSDGQTTVTDTVKVTKRVTYRQNWPAYNAAQTEEKAMFQVLLHDLCKTIPQPPRTVGKAPGGRKPLPCSDMVFATAFKVFSTVSARRFMSDLKEAHTKGYISKVPHFNSILNYLERPDLTPVYRSLITQSSLPLKSVETDFAIDSSGFSTCQTVTWFNARYGHTQDNSDWLKAHIMTGVKTNVVTSVEISGGFANDAPLLPPLVEATAQSFKLAEVAADKGYSSHKNLEAIASKGAVPYIPFKSNAVAPANGCTIWEKMYGYYLYNREQFLAHYHKRSNIESTFNMIKARFGTHLRSKGQIAQANELLCKILAHNIVVLIQSMHELGIKPSFCADLHPAQNPS